MKAKREYRGKTQCTKILICKTLLNMEARSLPIQVPQKGGIYAIKERNETLYVGFSRSNMRRRILAHIGGYDKQAIGQYLKSKQDLSTVTFAWVSVQKKAGCLESKFIDCVAQQEGFWPTFNMKSGNSKCEK